MSYSYIDDFLDQPRVLMTNKEQRNERQEYQELRHQMIAEEQLRRKHPALKEAWDKYMVLLKLCESDN